MSNLSKRLQSVIARIIFLMFAFGLMSSWAHACTLSKARFAPTSMTAGSQCQVVGDSVGEHAKCATLASRHADDCTMQAPAAVSDNLLAASPLSGAAALAMQAMSFHPPLRRIGLAAPPPALVPRPPIPLSILHCSFQI